MAARKRNYGLIGCLVVIALLGSIVVGLYFVIQWIDARGPSEDRIKMVTVGMVTEALAGQPVTAVSVDSIHSRRKRFALSIERWAVQGQVVEQTETGESDTVAYLAVVRTVCDDYKSLKCWQLSRLTVGNKPIRN